MSIAYAPAPLGTPTMAALAPRLRGRPVERLVYQKADQRRRAGWKAGGGGVVASDTAATSSAESWTAAA